jgi:hypothetical protein
MSTLAVCKRGHAVSFAVLDPVNRREAPIGREFDVMGYPNPVAVIPNFCSTCGAPVITLCEGCNVPIPPPRYPYTDTPVFCIACGDPYPWATREDLIGKLYSLLDFELGLSLPIDFN